MMAREFTPRPYQEIIIDRIIAKHALAVWCSMGMGKTLATLTALAQLRESEPWPVLVLAPLRVAQTTWPDEIKKWDHLKHLKVSVVAGKDKEGRVEALLEDADIYTANYEQLPWLVDMLEEWPFATVICDEATKLKSFRPRAGGVRARAFSQVKPYIKRLVELTGTPAPNGLLDLWGQMWFIDQGARLGKYFKHYQEAFFRPIRVGRDPHALRWDPLPGAEQQIMKRIDDVVVKINAEDYFDIEEPIVQTLTVELPPKVRKLYDRMEREFYLELEHGEVEAANAAVKTSKLLQICAGGVYHDDNQVAIFHREKTEVIKSIISEANGMPVLVAYQFNFEREDLLERLKTYGARHFDRSPDTLRDWNAGKIPVLIAHPAACGHGLNMQDGGNILVFHSCGWNLEEYLQMIERIGPVRQMQSGHKRPVFIYHINVKNSMDEVVHKRLRTKQSVMDVLLEKVK